VTCTIVHSVYVSARIILVAVQNERTGKITQVGRSRFRSVQISVSACSDPTSGHDSNHAMRLDEKACDKSVQEAREEQKLQENSVCASN